VEERQADDAPTPDELGERAPEDERGTEPPAQGGSAEPDPGEDAGPRGNPAQDEEGLSHQQQDADPGQDAS
jgi:hypothetical protein